MDRRENDVDYKSNDIVWLILLCVLLITLVLSTLQHDTDIRMLEQSIDEQPKKGMICIITGRIANRNNLILDCRELDTNVKK